MGRNCRPARQIEPLATRQSYLAAASFAWGRTNVEQATAWALSLPAELQSGALSGVAEGLAEIDPKAAAERLANLVRAEMSPLATRDALFTQWLQFDQAGAEAWADALPAGEARNSMQAKLLERLTMSGKSEDVFRRAAALPAEQAGSAALFAAQMLARSDGQKAAVAALDFARGTQQHEPLGAAVLEWFTQDCHSATAWVEQLPAGPARDAAAAGCAGAAIRVDAETAKAWVGQIADATRRAEAAKRVAARWSQRDPAAAGAWLASQTAP